MEGGREEERRAMKQGRRRRGGRRNGERLKKEERPVRGQKSGDRKFGAAPCFSYCTKLPRQDLLEGGSFVRELGK